MKLLTIVGSLQKRSSNKALMTLVGQRVPGGVELDPFSAIGELPHYNADLDTEEAPQIVTEWRARLGAADGVLIASPEYGHGVPGSLKNALDWIVGSGEFGNKPVAVTCAAQGPERGRMGLAMLVQTLRAIDAKLMWSEPVIVLRTSIDARGEIVDPAVDRQLDTLIAALVAAVRASAG